ncbi:DNA primase [Campylobacterota bacterium]|nr:DNA primase [Campylobacterota bacterium]
MIKSDSIALLKSRIDIVDVIGSYVELKRSGANFMGRCPFHEERSPSFSVSSSRGAYHCFGCGASGDVIGFVVAYEHLSFSDAVEKLADTFNIALEYEAGAVSRRKDYRPLEALKRLFLAELGRNEQASEYLKTRALSEAMIERFEIGYAPESGAQLAYLSREQIPIAAATEAGVVATDETGRSYARFTKRITFPIYSPQGVLVGFGGRTIGNHPAKYINSPQSPFFDKSRLLFAYHVAKDVIVKRKQAIVCEGYMDAVMLHQAGLNNAIATLGTALTEHHLPLLKRLGEIRIVLSYDNDQAGIDAAQKASRLLASHGFEGGVAEILGGKDPAELIAAGATKQLELAYENPRPFGRYVIDTIVSKAVSKDAAFKDISSFLNTLSPFAKESEAGYAAAQLGTDVRRFGAFGKVNNAVQRGSKRDYAELALIKTLFLNSALRESLIDYLWRDLFVVHIDLYDQICEEAALYEVLNDGEIKELSADEARDSVRKLLFGFYTRELGRLRHEGTTTAIRELQKVIARLKNGELCLFTA